MCVCARACARFWVYSSLRRMTASKQLLLVIINLLSHVSVVSLLTWFCTSLTNGCTNSRMTAIQLQVSSIEGYKPQLINTNCGSTVAMWTQKRQSHISYSAIWLVHSVGKCHEINYALLHQRFLAVILLTKEAVQGYLFYLIENIEMGS